jgi:hypothetical protein
MPRELVEYPIPRLPQSLTEDGLRNLMRERPYWDLKHPRSEFYHRLVRRGFEMLYPGPAQYDGVGRMIDTPPRPPGEVARQVTQTNRELEAMERGFDERSSGSGEVHVQSHTRDGGRTEVVDYWRARPGEGGGEAPVPGRPAGRPENRTLEYRPGRDDVALEPLGPARKDDDLGAVNFDDEEDSDDRAEPTARENADEDIQLAEHAHACDPYPESPLDFEFRDRLAKAEHSHDKPNDGYGEHHKGSGALGRYQLKESSLQDADFKDKAGEWTEKAHRLGVHDKEDFLKNSHAQEKALEASTAAKDKQLETNGAKKHLGQTVQGIKGEFEITEARLAAAAHRHGARGTKDYLDHLKNHDWKSDPATFPPGKKREFHETETRLRTFERAPYRRRQDP